MNIENDAAACQLTANCGCSRRTDGRAGAVAVPPLVAGGADCGKKTKKAKASATGKSSQVKSIGYRKGVCCFCIDLT